jgi:hypothetical protein
LQNGVIYTNVVKRGTDIFISRLAAKLNRDHGPALEVNAKVKRIGAARSQLSTYCRYQSRKHNEDRYRNKYPAFAEPVDMNILK